MRFAYWWAMRTLLLLMLSGLLTLQGHLSFAQPNRRQFLVNITALGLSGTLSHTLAATPSNPIRMRFYVFRGHLLKAENLAYAPVPRMTMYGWGWKGPGPIPAEHFELDFISNEEFDSFWRAASIVLRGGQAASLTHSAMARPEVVGETLNIEVIGERAQARLLGMIRADGFNLNAFSQFATWLEQKDELHVEALPSPTAQSCDVVLTTETQERTTPPSRQ